MPRNRTILRDLRDDVKVAARFWTKVRRPASDECWPWTGALSTKSGYGRICVDGRVVNAHRVAWALTHGPIPEGMDVLHRCDNPPCVSPDHLFLGTHADNMRDRKQKGRNPNVIGIRNPKARLTEADVLAIRERRRNGDHRVEATAEQYGISVANYWAIVYRRSWKHLP